MYIILKYECSLAWRRLWRRRSQSGLLLLTFAISIALALLSWSLFHTIFLKNPAFDPEGRLCVVNLIASTPGARPDNVSREDVEVWKATQTVFTDLTLVGMYRSVFIVTDQSSERYLGSILSPEALSMVGAKPLHGRLFTPAEHKTQCAPVIILSQHTWENRFDADPDAIGRVVKVNGFPATIVGVMPESFRFPNSQDVWLPTGFNHWEWEDPEWPSFDALARLKPGYTAARAQADLTVILNNRGSGTFAAKYKLHPIVRPFREYYLFPSMHRSALILFALSLIFVLVSCANAANLVLIDFLGRRAELGSLLALGLPRGAAIRNVCLQVGLVAIGAGAMALLLLMVAAPSVHGALVLMVAPYWLAFGFSWHHAVMAVGLATLSTVAAVAAPIGYLLITRPERIMRDCAGGNRGTGHTLWRRLLLTGQIALLTLLGVAASLLAQSNQTIGKDHWGYDASKVFLGKLDMPRNEFQEDAERMMLFRKIIDEVRRLPGIHNAAVMVNPPGYSSDSNVRYALDTNTLLDGREDGRAISAAVTEGIFDTLGIPFLAGSTYPSVIDKNNDSEVVINDSLARRLWANGDAIGRSLYLRYPWMDEEEPNIHATVRGVIRDFQASGPKSTNNDLIYSPFGPDWAPSNLFFVASGTTSLPATREIHQAVWRVDPRVAPYFPDSIQHQIDMTLGYMRLTARLTTIFALAAAFLCGIGVYSITVSQILQQTREYGIRLALGVEPVRLWRIFARTHFLVVLLGVVLGLVLAALTMHTLSSLLFGINPDDVLTYVIVAVFILAIAGLASIPSLFQLRRINPADCLRTV